MPCFASLRHIAALCMTLISTITAAETLVESNVESRVTLAFKARDGELQNWLPAVWRVSPVAAGPTKDANLFVVFFQRLSSQGADGKPLPAGGTDRGVVLAVPAKHAQSGEEAAFITRVYTSDHITLPGPYKNSSRADVRRELLLKGENLEAGAASDNWEIKEVGGGAMVLKIAYERSRPARAKIEQKNRSAVEPNFTRIYRVDQGIEVVKSVPLNVDRMKDYEFRSTIPELSKVFDGSVQLVSVIALPWYVRQVSLP